LGSEGEIRRGQSKAPDSRAAVREFHAAIAQDDIALVVFFCSAAYDLKALAEEMNLRFAGVRVVGCTSAGEIGPAGYIEHSLTGASFPASEFSVEIAYMADLEHFLMSEGQAASRALVSQGESRPSGVGPDNSFALLLIDGLSLREEQVARAFQNGLGGIRLFGGSAGDDMKFEHTLVFYDGAFHENATVLVLMTTALPFKIFRTQHFVTEMERLVVTEADAAHRIVREIDGLPAATEYARIVGVSVEELRPALFAANPVVVVIDGTDYVRSIQKVTDDGSLTFYSAIDEGLVLRVARGVDLTKNLSQAFDALREEVGPPQLVIVCDCILRKLEMTQEGTKDDVGDIMRRNNAIGLNTYGEQIDGVHVNQTLTGIAIGYPRA
jgi:hypothetical protein